MKSKNISAIIVSAGYSSRMHNFKPFLEFGRYTAVERIINTLKNSGINDIILVVGHRGEEVIKKVKDYGVTCVFNENYPRGMYSSVLKGIEALGSHVTAFFICPVDIPLVKEYSINCMKKQYVESNKGIVYPNFCGKRGHPPLIDSKYIDAILSGDGEGGLKRLLQGYEDDSLDIRVCDEAILMDMDTEEDYQNLLKYFYTEAPNRRECYEILDIHKVSSNIIRHSSKVAKVSLELLDNLKDNGYHLKRGVLEAAALLHDIARKEKNHAQKAAKILTEMGYEEVAYIISTHMDITVDEQERITENEILYLADKLVREDKIVPLEIRLQQHMELYRGDTEVLAKIENRYDMAKKIIEKIKEINGEKLIYG